VLREERGGRAEREERECSKNSRENEIITLERMEEK
jgi:hypothetical protein